MMNNEKLTLTVDQTAEKLGISRASAYEGIHNGQIPHIRIGKRILVPLAAIENLLAPQSTKCKGAGQ